MTEFLWRDRPVFVTGGTGLLGSHLLEELAERGADLVALVRDDVARGQAVRGGLLGRLTVVHGDVRDATLLERVVNEYEVDTVFHLAAQTIVGTAQRSPGETFDVNITGTWRLLEACRRINTVKRVVVASSDKAYGASEVLPYSETTPLRGRHPYDVSKSCADLLAQTYAYSYDLPVVVTRCGNLFGPGDLNWNRIVPGTIRSALRRERPIIRSDGRLVRDYFYVKDAVAAYITAAEHAERRDLPSRAFNFSSGAPVDVLTLTQKILELTGSADLEPDIRNEAKYEIREQSLSSALAQDALGWRSEFSLERGLSETIQWYEELLKGE